MHVNESTALSSSGEVEIKEEVVDEPASTAATTSNAITTTTTTTANLTDVGSPNSVTDSTSPSRDSATASSDAVVPVNSLKVPLNSTNASDSAVETDDSSQDDMLIAPEDVKLEEVDSDCEDTVDGHMLHRLSQIRCKVEPDTNSNSSCSLNSFSNGFFNGESDASMRKRLFTSLSQSFPGSALSRVLHSMDTMPLDSDDEDLPAPDRLSSSCFGQISLEKGAIEDDELTSLAWLQDSDLLKNINAGEDDLVIGEDQKENSDGQKAGEGGGGGGFVPQTHPPHVPYNPHKHVNSKPPYSFSCLIFMAVEESPEKKLPVKDIYNWILTHFPYFQNAPTGWKNSVRHNLSLNKCFKKVEKDKGTSIGKGSLWCIDPDYRPNLLQALRKTPYHPYHQLQMMSTMQPQQHIHHVQGVPASGFRPMPLTQRPVPNTVSPHLFPFLSRRLAQTGFEYFDREMQDVANTLVAMKGLNSKNSSGLSSDGSDASGPTSAGSMLKRKFNGLFKHHGPIIVTSHPSEDHNYSSAKVREEDTASGTSSIDNEYDFGDEDDDISEPSDYPSDWDCGSDGDEVDGDLPVAVQRKRLRIDLKKKEEDKDEEEEKHEGAKLLLSFAGFSHFGGEGEEKHTPRKSSSSATNKTSSSSSSSSKSAKSLPASASSSKGLPAKASPSSTAASKSASSLSSSQSSSSSRASKSSSRTPLSKSSSKTSPSSKSTAATSSPCKSSVDSSPPPSSSSKPATATSSPTAAKAAASAPLLLSAKPSPSSASSSPSSTKSSIIMTRRGKAAAEAAAAAAAPGVCTRGKKWSSS